MFSGVGLGEVETHSMEPLSHPRCPHQCSPKSHSPIEDSFRGQKLCAGVRGSVTECHPSARCSPGVDNVL